MSAVPWRVDGSLFSPIKVGDNYQKKQEIDMEVQRQNMLHIRGNINHSSKSTQGGQADATEPLLVLDANRKQPNSHSSQDVKINFGV